MATKTKRKLSAAQKRWRDHVKATMKKYPKLSLKEALRKASPTYKKSTSQKTKKVKSPTSKSKSKRKNPMAQKKNKNKRRRTQTFPMATITSLAVTPFVPGSFAKGWASPYDDYRQQGIAVAAANYGSGWCPVNLRAAQEGQGIKLHVPPYPVMLILGAATSKVASWLGVNRYLARIKGNPIRV